MNATFGDALAVNYSMYSQMLEDIFLHPIQLLQFLIPAGHVNIFQIFTVNSIKKVKLAN